MAHGGPRRSGVSEFTAEGLGYEGGFTAESTEDTERAVESSKEGIRAEGDFWIPASAGMTVWVGCGGGMVW